MGTTTIMLMTGFHVGDNAGSGPGDAPGFDRDPTSWERRVDEFIAAANTASADVAINLGDLVDGNATNASRLTLMQSSTTKFDDGGTGLDMTLLDSLGNHVYGGSSNTSWNGADSKPTLQDFYDELAGSSSRPTFANTYGPSSQPRSYTWDSPTGIRFINFNFPFGSSPIDSAGTTEDYLGWLNDRLDECDAQGKPCIVFSHCHSWQNPDALDPANKSTFAPSDAHWATLSAMYDGTKNLQAVFGGHLHRGGQSMSRNGIFYIDTLGSVSIREGDELIGNAYLKVELIPKVVTTTFGDKANVRITGFGYSTSDSRDWDHYLVG